jgi:hypothetical protein
MSPNYRSVEPLPRRFEDHGQRVLVLGRLVGGSRLGEATSTWRWRGCGPCASTASPPCRRSETSAPHAKRSAPPTNTLHRLRTISPMPGTIRPGSPLPPKSQTRASRSYRASPPAVPRDPGRIQRARRRLLARGRTPAPDTPPPPATNDRDGPHVRNRRRPEPARRSGISARRGREDDLAAPIEELDRGPAHLAGRSFGASSADSRPADRCSAAA